MAAAIATVVLFAAVPAWARWMAERELQRILEKAQLQFGARCAALHRVGKVLAGETSIVIAASSPHRAQAFEACRWVMDEIKSSVPIWKKEVASSGAWWVEDPTLNDEC